MKIKKNITPAILIYILSMVLIPALAKAQHDVNPEDWISEIMTRVATVVWQLFAGLTVVMFVVAGILFVTSNGEPGKITTARNAVIWGVVGIVVATAAFAVVQFVSGLAGV